MQSKLKLRLRAMIDTKRLKLWIKRTLLRDPKARQLPHEPCPRDYCALYRTEALREHKLSFVSKGGYSAGVTVYNDLKALGYRSAFIPVPEMMDLMDHVAHATGGILPERKHDRTQQLLKTRWRLNRLFHRDDVADLMEDESLEI